MLSIKPRSLKTDATLAVVPSLSHSMHGPCKRPISVIRNIFFQIVHMNTHREIFHYDVEEVDPLLLGFRSLVRSCIAMGQGFY